MTMSYVIHIGYHKTGTTWLQRHYFSRRSAGLAFHREREGLVPDGIDGRTSGRYICEQPLFHYNPKRARAALDSFFSAEIAAGLTPVISYEELSGNPISGGWRAKEYAWRLAESFPEARIIIVVREQRTMIRASYMQYLRAGGGMSLRDFMVPSPDPNVPQPDLFYFRYNGLLQLYRDLFSTERVLCLPFELFRDRPREFLARLDSFTGAEPDAALPIDVVENRGSAMLQYPLLRVVNPLIKRDSANGRSPYAMTIFKSRTQRALRALGRMAPRKWDRAVLQRWERQIEAQTSGFYEASNKALGEMIGYELGQFGWRIG